MTPIEKQFEGAIQEHSRVAHDYVLDSSDAAEACYAIHKSECDNTLKDFILWWKGQSEIVKRGLDGTNILAMYRNDQQSK